MCESMWACTWVHYMRSQLSKYSCSCCDFLVTLSDFFITNLHSFCLLFIHLLSIPPPPPPVPNNSYTIYRMSRPSAPPAPLSIFKVFGLDVFSTWIIDVRGLSCCCCCCQRSFLLHYCSPTGPRVFTCELSSTLSLLSQSYCSYFANPRPPRVSWGSHSMVSNSGLNNMSRVILGVRLVWSSCYVRLSSGY